MKDFYKRIKSNPVLSALIIGVIGSTLWEKIFSPITGVFLEKLLSVGGIFIDSISSYVYTQISYGPNDIYSEYFFLIIACLFLVINIIALREAKENYSYQNNRSEAKDKSLNGSQANEPLNIAPTIESIETAVANLEKQIKSFQTESVISRNALEEAKSSLLTLSKKTYIFEVIILVISSVTLVLTVSMVSYIKTTATSLTNNIEIVSPYISDLDYKHLKSDFYSMSSRNDYNTLTETLNEIAIAHGLSLK